MIHLVHPGIVNSHDTSQKNRDKPDTHHDNDKPMLEIRRCEETFAMIRCCGFKTVFAGNGSWMTTVVTVDVTVLRFLMISIASVGIWISVCQAMAVRQ